MPRTRLPAAERRDQLLDAANTVFSKVGFEATRMEDVAEAAGVAKGLLYKHFDSKDALFEALLEREGGEFAESLRRRLEEGAADGPMGALRAGLSVWLQEMADGAPSFYFHDPGSHHAYQRIKDLTESVIAESLRAYEPVVDVAVARLLAAAVRGAAEAVGLAWQASPDLGIDDVLGLLSGFIWGGFQTLQAWTGPVE
jgi:AcrR family transcriptional regulator